MSGYQGYPQGQWSGGYDEGRAWATPGNSHDEWYSEMNLADSGPVSRFMPGASETFKRPAPNSEEDFTGFPIAKRPRSERGGLPIRDQGQEADWRHDTTDEADRPGTFFVFNLMPNTTASDLFEYFVEFGDLMKFDIFINDEGKCTGTGIVQFVNKEAAVAALAAEPHFIHKKQVIMTPDRNDDPKTNLTVRKSLETHKLFVTEIPFYVCEEDLCEYFSQWGNISYCDVEGRTSRTRHVFVSYTNYDDAVECLNTTHSYGQSAINVLVSTHCKALQDVAKAGNNSSSGSEFQSRRNSLFVSNVPDDVSLEELTEHFSMWGEIISYAVGGKFKENNNFGFLRYKEQEDALRAVIMPHTLKSQRVFVCVSQRKSGPLLRASKDPEVMSAIEEKCKKCYLYVPFLSASTTEEMVYDHFKMYGSLAFCMIIPSSTNMPVAHIAYAKEADAAYCFNEDHFLNDDHLFVRWSDRTKWGRSTNDEQERPATPPSPPTHNRRDDNRRRRRRAGRHRHGRRAGRRRRNRHRYTGPARDVDLAYPQCDSDFDDDDDDDGRVSSWTCGEHR